MIPNIGLTDEQLNGSVGVLTKLLADEFLLYTKTRNCHWNVIDPSFFELHKFFEEQYEELAEIKDEIAERTRSLGGVAIGTMAGFISNSRLIEQQDFSDSREMISVLLDDHETIIQNIRVDANVVDEKFEDAGTNDFLIGIMEKHEKIAWMLRSFMAKTR